MKLNEILEPNIEHKRFKKSFFATDKKKFSYDQYRIKKNPEEESIGSGHYYTVHDIKDNPHEVTKKSKRPFKARDKKTHDAYYMYIKELIDNKLIGNNIFAPYVYDIKVVKDKNGDKHYDFKMEKLISYNNVDEEEIRNVLNRVFVFNEDNYNPQFVKFPHMWISEYIMRYLQHDNKKIIKSKQLKELLDLIKNIMYKYDLANDMAINNIMYRRTPYGVQLVITDPLS